MRKRKRAWVRQPAAGVAAPLAARVGTAAGVWTAALLAVLMTGVMGCQAGTAGVRGERAWLASMVEGHGYSDEEVAAGMGWEVERARGERERLKLRRAVASGRDGMGRLRVLPYPGGRHPRIGFLEGAVEPRRETKVSVFAPWEGGGYVVVDVPEAVFCDRGLIFLAHKHIPTVWETKGMEVERQAWRVEGEGMLASRTMLPDGVEIAVRVESGMEGVRMRWEVFNGSDKPLKEVRGQVCVMLKGAKGFAGQSEAGVIKEGMWAARKAEGSERWVVVGWRPVHRTWNNAAVPCIHSDPWIGEVKVGESKGAEGVVWFYEGEDVRGEMKRKSAGSNGGELEPEKKRGRQTMHPQKQELVEKLASFLQGGDDAYLIVRDPESGSEAQPGWICSIRAKRC